MTPRERVLAVLHGELPPVVPFTMYGNKLQQCRAEREMRNRGMCILDRRTPVKTHRPNVHRTEEAWYDDAGNRFTRTRFESPAGVLTTLHERFEGLSWCREKLFKTPDDYKALRFFIEDEQYEEDYAEFVRAERAFGGDAIVRAGLKLEPLQALISGELMGIETFCIEWMDRRDEVLALYEALVEQRRRLYPLVAESPATHANYGGNVMPEITGPRDFERYYLPHYNEAAEIFHEHGKLLGGHFDANCGPLAASIAKTDLDYIEAFTPAPDTDMTLAEARAAWPDKTLWLNFPSSLHLRPDEDVEEATVGLLNELESPAGVIMGITEDVPEDRWRQSCTAIMDGLDRHAAENPGAYRERGRAN